MGIGVYLIVKLVRQDGAGSLFGNLLSLHYVIIGMVRGDCRRRDHHLGAKRLQQSNLLLRHFVGHSKDAAIALQCGGDCQTDSGVSAGAFHDGAARPQLALALGLLDDGQPDPILYRTARIDILRLAIDRRSESGSHPGQADEWSPTNGLQNRVIGLEMLRRSHGRAAPERGLRNCTG